MIALLYILRKYFSKTVPWVFLLENQDYGYKFG